MKQQILLMGKPGSGKGTLASRLELDGYTHISMGELLRKEIASGSDIGLKVKDIVATGKLVSDAIAMQILEKTIDIKNQQYIFDGFPRCIDQAKLLDRIVGGRFKKIVHIITPNDVIIERLIARVNCLSCGYTHNNKFGTVCPKCGSVGMISREDDNIKTIKERLKLFDKETLPVIERYAGKGIEILNLTLTDIESQVYVVKEFMKEDWSDDNLPEHS